MKMIRAQQFPCAKRLRNISCRVSHSFSFCIFFYSPYCCSFSLFSLSLIFFFLLFIPCININSISNNEACMCIIRMKIGNFMAQNSYSTQIVIEKNREPANKFKYQTKFQIIKSSSLKCMHIKLVRKI